MDADSDKMRKKKKKKKGGGVHTAPLSGSLLPVVMVIRGFGQDYEIFYLVASVLLGRPFRLACSSPASPLEQFKDTRRTEIVTFTCKHTDHIVKQEDAKEDEGRNDQKYACFKSSLQHIVETLIKEICFNTQ